VAANITPDNDTGIGKWSDEQIVNAIRSGKRPEGTLIGPAMPIVFYRNMTLMCLRSSNTYGPSRQ
jgi:hypothetical protein